MKQSILLSLFFMVIVMTVCAQKNNVFWSMRVKVKMDKRQEWEKKAPLFMKTHNPHLKFTIYEVLNGEHTGSYVIVVGPTTYEAMDAPPVFPKGEQAWKTDRFALDALCESLEATHFRRDDEISTLDTSGKFNYVFVNEVEINLGAWTDTRKFIMKQREVAKASALNSKIDYFRPLNTDIQNSFTVVRYLEKLSELDIDYNFTELYDKAHGNAAWHKDITAHLARVKSAKRELRVLRTDLSSPNPVNTASSN